MPTPDRIYNIGTVSVANGDTVIVGSGGPLWESNGRAYDRISIDGFGECTILDVTDDNHLAIDPWPFATVPAGTDYKLLQTGLDRVTGAEQSAIVVDLVEALDSDGFIWFVGPDEAEPPPRKGKERQFAEQPDTGKKWVRQGGVWKYLGIADPAFSRYDIVIDIPERPASGATMAKWVAPSLVMFRAGLIESRGNADENATANSVFSLKKNGVQFATATFASANKLAIFACATDTAFAAGDVLTVIAPNPRDATLSNIALTIVGFR